MSDNDTLRRDCPSCGCPGQWVDLHCGMCGSMVPALTGVNVDKLGHALVEEVIGWRAFSVRYPDGVYPTATTESNPLLVSPVVSHYEWAPGVEWYYADCQGTGNPEFLGDDRRDEWHTNDQENPARIIPAKECNGGGHGCGFYAGRTHAHLISLGYVAGGGTVMAKIQMQGKIIPATNGFRAQQVKILTLYVPYEEWPLARDLRRAYPGVEVECGQTRMLQANTAPAWCEKCGAKMGRDPVCPLCGYRHQ